MPTAIHDKLTKSIQMADAMYHRLVLLVGEPGSGKTAILQDIAQSFETSPININLILSSELLELTPKQRSLRLPDILDRVVNAENSPVILDNLEILFDKALMQDPLRLLQSISRNRTIVSSWNGAYTDGRLTYAESGHTEYRRYDSIDALIVCTDGTATIDNETHI